MKNIKILFFACFLIYGSMSHAQKRLEDFGYKVETLTLSEGKYLESFTNDTLVQVGSVILNKRTKKVVSFITYDTLYSEATLEPEIVSRFIQPDPHAHKYGEWTPYNYAFNNPIFFNDPDGRDGKAHYESGDGTKDNPHVITITANYYYNTNNLTEEEASALGEAVGNYNGTVSKSGKSKDGTYTVTRFALSAVGLDSDDAVNTAAGADTFTDAAGETRGFGNIVSGREAEGTEFGDADGLNIRVNRTNIADAVSEGFSGSDLLEGTFNHEIGHNLGGEHGDPSPMAESMRLYYRQEPNKIGGAGIPTVPSTSVTNKFGNTIKGRIGTPSPTNSGHVLYQQGRTPNGN